VWIAYTWVLVYSRFNLIKKVGDGTFGSVWRDSGRASCDRNDFLHGLGWIKYLIQNIPKHEQELQAVRI
jgi:hypothetical protein